MGLFGSGLEGFFRAFISAGRGGVFDRIRIHVLIPLEWHRVSNCDKELLISGSVGQRDTFADQKADDILSKHNFFLLFLSIGEAFHAGDVGMGE
jgi:hypothetical protein